MSGPNSSLSAARAVHGLRANWRQFVLLVAVSCFVGAMVGLQRSVLPLLAHDEFGVGSTTAVLGFVATFAFAKAVTNLAVGPLSGRFTRRHLLIAGWVAGAPVPLMIIFAPSWGWVLAANLLLGVNQGLTWSMTVNMKMDLAGPRRRGLALGINESAGYLAVAVAAFLSGLVAEAYGLRPEPFYLGIAVAAGGLALSAFFVKDTAHLLAAERSPRPPTPRNGLRTSFAEASWRDRELFGITQAGFINNLNDALAWGVFPLYFAAHGLSLDRIALLAGVYPLVWGGLQLVTGALSDVTGRKSLIVAGMLLQGGALVTIGVSHGFTAWLAAVSLLGMGTAMVYPTLLAAIGDSAAPQQRAATLGVYRFWRDGGAVAGALAAGILADVFNFEAAIIAIAALTFASGLTAQVSMGQTQKLSRGSPAPLRAQRTER